MLVANGFDLWQKDTFFSAAEEVQSSADIMESAYRTWVRERREGLPSSNLDELCRELQTALATAKWQLDEFQRAVRMSYRNRADDITTTRHKQFVSAIESQISRFEEALKECLNHEKKKPLRWINLDEEECDDLALFLSGVPTKGSDSNFKDSLRADKSTPFKDFVKGDVNRSIVVEAELIEVMGTSDGSSCQGDKKASSRRTWSSQDVGITIDHDNEQKKPLTLTFEKSMSKDKGSVWKPRFGRYWINQIFRRAVGSQRQLQTSIQLQRSCSFRVMLFLMLTIFLLVPFVMYSN